MHKDVDCIDGDLPQFDPPDADHRLCAKVFHQITSGVLLVSLIRYLRDTETFAGDVVGELPAVGIFQKSIGTSTGWDTGRRRRDAAAVSSYQLSRWLVILYNVEIIL